MMALSRTEETAGQSPGLKMDPIAFEVLRSAFDAAADEMGVALRKAAYSTNIKTRADFSCALFDADLRLIAQSFSQPVHLASMSRMVPSAIRQYGPERLEPGDAVVMNDSHRGGVHLNDIGIIAPLFAGGEIRGYAATIAHHTDIGGYASGGYCISSEIYQEGIIIPPVKLVTRGEINSDVFNLIVGNIRAPRQMGGDFRAQIAASLLGRSRRAPRLEVLRPRSDPDHLLRQPQIRALGTLWGRGWSRVEIHPQPGRGSAGTAVQR